MKIWNLIIKEIVYIDQSTQKKTELKGDYFFSTMPVKELIKNTVNKVLRPGVKSLKNPRYYEKSEEAFYVLNKYKKDFDGFVRNPETVNETLDTLKNAKAKIYGIYDDISKSSGELGARFNPQNIMSDLSNWVKQTGYSQDVKEYATKQLQNLSDLNGVSPSIVQDRIEELNSGLNLFAQLPLK